MQIESKFSLDQSVDVLAKLKPNWVCIVKCMRLYGLHLSGWHVQKKLYFLVEVFELKSFLWGKILFFSRLHQHPRFGGSVWIVTYAESHFYTYV